MRFFRIVALIMAGVALTGVSIARAEPVMATALPAISNERLTTIAPVVYEQVEIQFDVTTVATNLYMPFDAHPPKGVPPGLGISVDGLFSSDGWKTTITQPAFLYQDYDYTVRGSRDHFVPDGVPEWRIRFAPQSAGGWQYRIRVVDRNGSFLSSSQAFTVFEGGGDRYTGLRESPYTRDGFIRVSKTDPRYFEFQDKTPFYAQGYNASFNELPATKEKMAKWQANGMNLVRIWLSSASINSSAWSSWTYPGEQTGNSALTSDVTAPGSDFSWYLYDGRPCVYTDFNQKSVPVTPGTKYHVWARVKLKGVKPWDGKNGGFTMRAAGFSTGCAEVKGQAVNPPVVLGTTDWTVVEADLTTRPDQYWLPYLWLILDKAYGEVWIDQVRLYRADDPAKINLLREPRAESVYEFDPMNSFLWDQYIVQAENKGIYLKLVTDEKSEWIRNRLAPEGGVAGKASNSNFYARPDTQVRWLDQAWWRYLIARWGYSTAIHSFEFVNEGDPNSTLHFEAANAMGSYFRENDPARHLITTSFWHSYPGAQFWGNPAYSAIDYADLHAYILTGWGDNAAFVPDANIETRPQYVRSAPTSLHLTLGKGFNQALLPSGLNLQEQGEWIVRYWVKGQDVRSKCARGSGALVFWQLGGDGEQGVTAVPSDASKINGMCPLPAGTFDWTEISSDQNPKGATLPVEQRIVIDDNKPHEFRLFVRDRSGVSGEIWIDDLQVVTPSGKVLPTVGSLDTTSFTSDTAWYTAAYSLLLGANSPLAAKMPIIRGESGINSRQAPNGLLDLNKDQQGVWLHNLIWGQINPGGMYELPWWGNLLIDNNPKAGRNGDLFWQYKTFQEFMWDIPINNGNYRDAEAITSDPNLRAWGQRDDVNGRAHLWIQNRLHTWDRVIAGQDMPPLAGTVTLRDIKSGTYRVEWWDTSQSKAPVLRTEMISAKDTLILTLPSPLTTDIAVKVARIDE